MQRPTACTIFVWTWQWRSGRASVSTILGQRRRASQTGVDADGLPAQVGVVSLFDGRVVGVHVDEEVAECAGHGITRGAGVS